MTMTKSEFLSELALELNKNKIPDADDIISEYEQHFAFKTADGFSEEEIASRLGDPAVLARQFEASRPGASDKGPRGRRILTVTGLVFADFFIAMLFIVLIAWEIVMAVFTAACAVISVFLAGGLNIASLLPGMPYGNAVLFAVSFALLAVISAAGTIYFAAFVRQLMRSYGRFHHNALAADTGKGQLPSLPINPQLPPRANRRLRTLVLIATVFFVIFCVSSFIASMIASGAAEFWHVWGWFVK